jgi:hypothetical protein
MVCCLYDGVKPLSFRLSATESTKLGLAIETGSNKSSKSSARSQCSKDLDCIMLEGFRSRASGRRDKPSGRLVKRLNYG